MTDNKDTPAFPTITWDQLETGQIVQVINDPGVSKLEFIACNAPVDIPSWFVHMPPEKNVSERPKSSDIENDEDRKEVEAWQHDPIYDLPEHLQWYSDKRDKAWTEESAYERENKEARYFQWRRYYAEQLLLTLSKPQP